MQVDVRVECCQSDTSSRSAICASGPVHVRLTSSSDFFDGKFNPQMVHGHLREGPFSPTPCLR